MPLRLNFTNGCLAMCGAGEEHCGAPEKILVSTPLHIAVELRSCVDDARFWFAHKTYPPIEAAIRFHQQLTVIHPFPNGNGRHARIMADALLEKVYGMARIDWADGENLQVTSERRTQYINALKAADVGEFGMLMEFAGVSQ
jgi:Fic-DOC domain mobile mystery protein B